MMCRAGREVSSVRSPHQQQTRHEHHEAREDLPEPGSADPGGQPGTAIGPQQEADGHQGRDDEDGQDERPEEHRA